MPELHIARGLSLPLKAATQTIAITGIRGSGKTNTAGVFVEEVLTVGLPALIFDPTDSWWGLKSEYEVLIFGGEHGDLPLDEHQGKTLAEFVVAERVPIVLSTARLGIAAQRRLVTELLVELYKLKAKDVNRYPLLVVIDEAPLFVPQRFTGPEAACVGAVERIVAQGRRFGFGVILISQRAATINKNVLTQAETLVIHRLTSPHDRKALKEWVEENASTEQMKAIAESLAGQPQGDAWVWSPGLDVLKHVHIRARRTFDSSSSPELGKKLAPPKNLKQIDLARWKGRLAAAIEQRDANDPVALRKQVADLKRQLAERPAAEPVVERVEVPTVPAWLVPLTSALLDLHGEISGRIQEVAAELRPKLNELHHLALGEVKEPAAAAPSRPMPPRTPMLPPVARPRPMPAEWNGAPKRAQVKVLQAVAMRHPRPCSRTQAGAIAGYRADAGHFYNLISECCAAGWLERLEDGDLRVTQAGIDALGPAMPQAPATHEAVMALWSTKLTPRHRQVLEGVVAARSIGTTREELADTMGMRADAGHFYNLISHIVAMGLIRREQGRLYPAEELWP